MGSVLEREFKNSDPVLLSVKPPRLREVLIEVTRSCPLKCIHCSSDGGSPALLELGPEELERIIDSAHSLGATNVCVSGGEPIDSVNLVEFCRYARSQEMQVSIYTCGNQLDDRMRVPVEESLFKEFRASGVDKIIFSLHGHTAAIHESITLVKGSFRNTLLSLKRAEDVGLHVEIHFVPMRVNYLTLPKVMSLAQTIGVRQLSVLRFVPHGRGYLNKAALDLTSRQVAELYEILLRMKMNDNSFVRLGSPFNSFGIGESKKCSAGLDKLMVTPDGLVFPCVSMKHLFVQADGNDIRQHALTEIWTASEVFSYTRRLLGRQQSQFCMGCDRFGTCRGGCPTQSAMNAGQVACGRDPYCVRPFNPT